MLHNALAGHAQLRLCAEVVRRDCALGCAWLCAGTPAQPSGTTRYDIVHPAIHNALPGVAQQFLCGAASLLLVRSSFNGLCVEYKAV